MIMIMTFMSKCIRSPGLAVNLGCHWWNPHFYGTPVEKHCSGLLSLHWATSVASSQATTSLGNELERHLMMIMMMMDKLLSCHKVQGTARTRNSKMCHAIMSVQCIRL